MTQIRPIAPHDREVWARLFHAYGVFYETDFDDAVITGVWDWLMQPGFSISGLVAVDDAGEVVGFAHLRELPDTFTAASAWYLEDLFVDPAARGGGVATALIDACFARSGGTQVRWMTAADNHRAQSVYDKVATRTSWVIYEKDS